jgi:hypothetical protein
MLTDSGPSLGSVMSQTTRDSRVSDETSKTLVGHGWSDRFFNRVAASWLPVDSVRSVLGAGGAWDSGSARAEQSDCSWNPR